VESLYPIKNIILDEEEDHKYKIKKILSELNDTFRSKLSEAIENEKEGSIGYEVDREIGTNQHVFSIMGPNGNGSGYGEVSIIMKQDVMEHPDFNMTPTAGTSFHSGEMYNHRSWAKIDKSKKEELEKKELELSDRFLDGEDVDDELVKVKKELIKIDKMGEEDHFHKSKLNAKENPKYSEYMAKDIAAQGSIDDYLTRSSHGKWEGHLPAFVPMNQFAEVVMTGKTLKSFALNSEEKGMIALGKELNESMGLIEENKSREKIKKYIENKYGFSVIEVIRSNDILPYINKGFKEGKWKKK